MKTAWCVSIVVLTVVGGAGLPIFGSKLPAGPYFGLEPPGLVPEVFGPGMICLTERQERGCVFSPDGREFFLTTTFMNTSYARRLDDDTWTSLKDLYFAPTSAEPFVAPDGKRIFFNKENDVHVSEKVNDRWSQPVKLANPINSSAEEYFPTTAANGTLYFCSKRSGADGGIAVFRSQPVDGAYTSVEKLPPPINTYHGAWDPMIAPDESYMIVAVGLPGYGQADLFISFRNDDDTWTMPRNLGPQINTDLIEYGPRLSPDGKYFFFSRLTGWRASDLADIYWVNIRAILPDPS